MIALPRRCSYSEEKVLLHQDSPDEIETRTAFAAQACVYGIVCTVLILPTHDLYETVTLEYAAVGLYTTVIKVMPQKSPVKGLKLLREGTNYT